MVTSIVNLSSSDRYHISMEAHLRWNAASFGHIPGRIYVKIEANWYRFNEDKPYFFWSKRKDYA